MKTNQLFFTICFLCSFIISQQLTAQTLLPPETLESWFEQGQFDKVENYIAENIESLKPKAEQQAAYHILRGRIYNALAVPEQAIIESDIALELLGDIKHDLSAKALLGKAYAKILQAESAKGDSLFQLILANETAYHDSIMVKVYADYGYLQVQRNNFEQALDYINIAFELAQQIKIGLADSYVSFGYYYNAIGDYDKAIEFYLKATDEMNKETPTPSWHLLNLYADISTSFSNKGEMKPALDYIDKGLSIAENILPEQHYMKASFLGVKGNIFRFQGQMDMALLYFEEGLKKIPNSNRPTDAITKAELYLNAAMTCSNAEKFDVAEEYLQKSIKIQEQYSTNFATGEYNLALSYINLADVLYFKGTATENTSFFEKAISKYEYARQQTQERLGAQHPLLVQINNQAALCYQNLGEYKKAAEFHEDNLLLFGFKPNATKPFETLIDPMSFNIVLWNKGEIYRHIYDESKDLNDLQAAALTFEQETELLDYIRIHFQTNNAKLSLSEENKVVYERAIDTHLDLYNNLKDESLLEEILAFSEKSKGLLLLETMEIQEVVVNSPILKLRIAEIDSLKNLVNSLKSESVPNGEDFQRTSDIYYSAQQALEKDFPDYYAAQSQLQPIDLNTIRNELLDDNTALLQYFIGDSNYYILLLTKDDIVVEKIPKEKDLSKWVKNFQDGIYTNRITGETNAVQTAELYAASAYELYKIFVAPIKEQLPEKVIIVPDGVLNYVAFDAFLVEQAENPTAYHTHHYLLNDHQISYAYSATLLKKMKDKKVNPEQGMLALAPNYPQRPFSKDYLALTARDKVYALKHNQKEAEQINKLWGGELLVDEAASLNSFLEKAANHQLIHFAGHAQADSTADSRLLFSPMADSNYYKLYASDIYSLQLHAEMVVMSACQTGIGKLQKGEGMLSLARSFAYAGAKSMLSSLWVVEDKSTMTIMESFYTHLKAGKSKSEALWLAKKDYIARNSGNAEPYFWAAFIPIGDMSAIGSVNRDVGYNVLFLLLGGVLSVGMIWWFRVQNRNRQQQ